MQPSLSAKKVRVETALGWGAMSFGNRKNYSISKIALHEAGEDSIVAFLEDHPLGHSCKTCDDLLERSYRVGYDFEISSPWAVVVTNKNISPDLVKRLIDESSTDENHYFLCVALAECPTTPLEILDYLADFCSIWREEIASNPNADEKLKKKCGFGEVGSSTSSFEVRCFILAELYLCGDQDADFGEFVRDNHLSVTLAYAIYNGMVHSADLGEQILNEAFELFLSGCNVADSESFKSLNDIREF